MVRYISLFSGIEAASVAWESLGWEPVAFSEIEPFPCELLRQRYPSVPNLGDITKIDWREHAGTVDFIVGGSPCQSFSIAGNREGLSGESGLMFEYIRAIREVMPEYFVWENVPGALSCEKGAAFGQLIREMDELGYGLAWRVLDAQFFGVAQRRRRVFLVGVLGDPERAAEILFEPESLRWDHPSSRCKRKELAESVERGAGSSYTLLVRCGCAGGGKGALVQEDVSATLSTSNVQTLFQPIADGISECLIPRDTPPTVCMASTQANAEVDADLCGTLTRRSYKDAPAVSFPYNCGGKAAGTCMTDGTAPTIRATKSGEPAVACGYAVRRLMPTECERLQGFPDGWTDIQFKGKPATDTARYKALGNSMPVPVMRWIGERIEEQIVARDEMIHWAFM